MIIKPTKPILDACCGSRMFWFDPKNSKTLFVDNRQLDTQAIWKSSDGRSTRYCKVDPDLVADFRALPFPAESFWHVVFDPPHLCNVGENAWMAKKYGKLPKDWRPLIHDGFHECWRVLKTYGTLIFKWNETQIPTKDVISAIGMMPDYGHKSGRLSKTQWMAFVKVPVMPADVETDPEQNAETVSVENPEQALRVLRAELDRRTTYKWKRRDGYELPVKSMSDMHLKNAIAMLERTAHEHVIALGERVEIIQDGGQDAD